MTSYQRRKAEIKELKRQLKAAQSLAQCAKAYLLAESRGQDEHATQCRTALIKRIALPLAHICEKERYELTAE